MRRLSVGPAWRLSIGLASIVVTLLISVQLLLDVMPGAESAERRVAQELGQALAVQVATLIEARDTRTLERTLDSVTTTSQRIDSVGVRQRDGHLFAQTRGHQERWQQAAGQPTAMLARVPLLARGEPWGEVEIVFRPVAGLGMPVWHAHPFATTVVLVALLATVFFYFYLRRSLWRKHPRRSVQDRVREAFDALPDGVAVLDHHGRIVLTNRAFGRLHPHAAGELTGQVLSLQAWLSPALPHGPGNHPWDKCLTGDEPGPTQLLQIQQPGGTSVQVIVHCAPVIDDRGEPRGCLVSFDNVSDLQRANERLRNALSELEASRRRVERQNRQLHRLATVDVLTDCLNRRAFFEESQALFAHAATHHKPLACIMADIDRFKSINDRYGHALGDQVIGNVATLLRQALRNGDVLCRYGGEEFCIALPDTTFDAAIEVAQRLREQIEMQGSAALRAVQPPRVTCSFGVAALHPGIGDLDALIAAADLALYAAKEAGRNRVMPAESRPRLDSEAA